VPRSPGCVRRVISFRATTLSSRRASRAASPRRRRTRTWTPSSSTQTTVTRPSKQRS
jgi:hypothetical protein